MMWERRIEEKYAIHWPMPKVISKCCLQSLAAQPSIPNTNATVDRALNSLTRIMSSKERFKDYRASTQLTGVRKDKSVYQT